MKKAERIKKHTLVPPTIMKNGIEISIHTSPRLLKHELKLVFKPLGDKISVDDILVVPTCQKSSNYDI